jgi:hypothetical protein
MTAHTRVGTPAVTLRYHGMMRRLSIVCGVLGTVNVLLGLACWPSGFGEFTSTAFRINSNYSLLVETGELVESTPSEAFPTTRHKLFAGVQRASVNQATALGVLWIGQGVVLIGIAWVLNKQSKGKKIAEGRAGAEQPSSCFRPLH